MTKNFIHFLSETPCIISINGKEIGVIDNYNNLELDIITQCEKVFVTYSPISHKENYIPYTYVLNTREYPQSDNEYIKVIPFPSNHYDIIMKPFYYYQIEKSEILLNQTTGKYFVSIINDNLSRITIYSGTTMVFAINTYRLKKCQSTK